MKLEIFKQNFKPTKEKKTDRWLVWIGYVISETKEEREVEYFGRYCPTKKSVIGILKSILDNTAPYKMIVIDTEAQLTIPEETNIKETELKDFFRADA